MKVKHLGQVCVGPNLGKDDIQKAHWLLDNSSELDRAVDLLEVLSGETRLKITLLLAQMDELCVCDMADIIGTTVSAVSHQLKKLRDANIVQTRRDSQTIYYSLSKQDNVAEILNKLGLT